MFDGNPQTETPEKPCSKHKTPSEWFGHWERRGRLWCPPHWATPRAQRMSARVDGNRAAIRWPSCAKSVAREQLGAWDRNLWPTEGSGMF